MRNFDNTIVPNNVRSIQNLFNNSKICVSLLKHRPKHQEWSKKYIKKSIRKNGET